MMRQRAGGPGYATGGGSQNNYYGGYNGGGDGGGGYSSNGHGGGSSNAGYGGYSGGNQSYGGYSASAAGGGYGPSTGYASSSSAPADDNKYSKQSSPSTSFPSLGSLMGGAGGSNFLVLVCMLMGLWSIAMMGMWMNVRGKYNSVLAEFKVPNANALMDHYRNLQADLADAQGEKDRSVKLNERKHAGRQQELERENRLLQKERDELRVKYEGPDKEEEESRLQLREEAFQNQVALLQEATRKESKRNVLERFGPGPHEVQFSFTMQGVERNFVVEMAPLEYVPHAVHVFLEQVEHGLWNGCYFYLNGPHVIQAGPQLSDEDEASSDDEDAEDRATAMHPFKSQGLDQLAFPDYSDNFPHSPWTLGFTGRPGGPDFYINKVDNTKSHGPGGQFQHALEEQGDSCFGKITRGKEHAAALFAQPVYGDRSEWHFFLTEPVEINKAEILTKKPAAAAGEESSSSSLPEIDVPASQDKTQTEAKQKVREEESPHDPVQELMDKRKRKPRRPKIEHAVEP